MQAIYLDPPYGIKFGSNCRTIGEHPQGATRKTARSRTLTRQPEQVRAFRDTWKLGIHSYLAYLRDRLVVSRDLLTETGSVFVQIGDENVHLVGTFWMRCLGVRMLSSALACARQVVRPEVFFPVHR